MHRRRRTALTVSAAALVAAAPLLTACGSTAHPGAAAVVGGERITVSQLQGAVRQVRTAQREAATNDERYGQAVSQSGDLARTTLESLVLNRVLDRACADNGVTVSRKDVQTLRASLVRQAGSEKALEDAWLQHYNVAPSGLDANLRTQVQAQKLALRLGADMNAPTGQAVFWKAMARASKELRVDMNPRYGTWDMDKSRRTEASTPWLRELSAQPEQAPQPA